MFGKRENPSVEPSLEGGKVEQSPPPGVPQGGGRNAIRRVIEAAKIRLTGNQKKIGELKEILGEQAVDGALEMDKEAIASLEAATGENSGTEGKEDSQAGGEKLEMPGSKEGKPRDVLSQELVADLEKALSNRRFDRDEHAKFTEYMEEELGDPDLKKTLLDSLSTFGPEFSPARRFSLLADMMVFDNSEARKIAFEAIKGLLSSGISLESTIGAKEGFRGLLRVSHQEGWQDKLLQAMKEASLNDSGRAMLAEMMIEEGGQYQDVQDMLRWGGIQFSDTALIDHITDKFCKKFGVNPEEELAFVRGFRRNLGEVEVAA